MNASFPEPDTGQSPGRESTPPRARRRYARRALSIIALLGACIALLGAWMTPAFSVPGSAEQQSGTGTGNSTEPVMPTIVFVHGAWADNSGFAASITDLQDQGYRVIGASNPLRHLTTDSAYVASLLATIEGPIVLVGHSYGGAVISNAAYGNEQVKALVYINGWVPDEGESVLQLAQLNEGSLVPEALVPVPSTNPDGTEVVDLYLDPEKFREAFAADVDEETAAVLAATQRPFAEAAFGAPSGPVAWKTIPSWYLLGTEDKAIPPATQRYMAERAGSTITEVEASHVSMISQPEATTEIILDAVHATTGEHHH